MSEAQPQPQQAAGGQQQQQLLRADDILRLQCLSEDERQKYRQVMMNFWNMTQQHAQGTSEHTTARQKLLEYSTKFIARERQHRKMKSQQANPGQPGQPGCTTEPGPSQARTAPCPPEGRRRRHCTTTGSGVPARINSVATSRTHRLSATATATASLYSVQTSRTHRLPTTSRPFHHKACTRLFHPATGGRTYSGNARV
jgi:hypothetical protein